MDYAEDDTFIGIPVPSQERYPRTLKIYLWIKITSRFQDQRRAITCGLIILVNQYNSSNYETKELIYQFYLNNLSSVK